MAPRKQASNAALISTVSEFARKHRVTSDPYIAGLLQALESKKDLHVWAELNPLDYLPHPQAVAGAAQASLIRTLTVLRNVLVFAPVALTWMAVSEATTGFSKYIKNNGADVVNFLDFWQNGYGVLGNEWKIGNVARLDFFIVLLVIGLTLYVSRGSFQVDSRREAAEAAIDNERHALAIAIHAAMLDKRKITAVTINASLAGAIGRLVTATHNLEDASKVMEKASRKLPKQEKSSSSFLDSFSFEDVEPRRKSRRG
jgi:hypothetical protein